MTQVPSDIRNISAIVSYSGSSVTEFRMLLNREFKFLSQVSLEYFDLLDDLKQLRVDSDVFIVRCEICRIIEFVRAVTKQFM